MTEKYDCTSPMMKRLMEESGCNTMEELMEYIKSAQKTTMKLIGEDPETMITELIKSKTVGPALAAILTVKNIDPLWIVYGSREFAVPSIGSCPLLKRLLELLNESKNCPLQCSCDCRN